MFANPLHKVRLGFSPSDTPRDRTLKRISTVIMVILSSLGLGYLFDDTRSAFLHMLDTTLFLLPLLTLLVLHITKDMRSVFYFYAVWHMCLAITFMSVNGSIEGDVVVFINMPVASAAILGARRSNIFFVISFVVVMVFPLIDMALPRMTWEMAQSVKNPEGWVFHAPFKAPFKSGEALAFCAGIMLLYFFVRANMTEINRANVLIAEQQAALEKEHARSEGLLSAMLPDVIVRRLKAQDHGTIADDLPEVTVLFADIVEFTSLANKLPATVLVNYLNTVFSEFDALCKARGLEKIKTVGDAYMVVGGAPEPRDDHAVAVAHLAFELIEAGQRIPAPEGFELKLRIGIHSGPVVAGVIGREKLTYDTWGDTVNTAARMESHSAPGMVQITEKTHGLLAAHFDMTPRGMQDIKGKGMMKTWYLGAAKAI